MISILRKSLSHASAARLFILKTVLASLVLLAFVSLAHAQMQFNGIAGVLPINGETLGAQDHAVADPVGNVYITDPTTNQVFKVDVHGNATVFISASTLINGTAMSGPDGIVIDLYGNLYIADTYNGRIITVPAGGTPTLLAVNQSLPQPTNLAVDNSGNVYVSMFSNPQIYKIAPPNGTTTLVGTSPYTLNNPQGLAVDSSGALYIADTGNARVLKAVSGNATLISTGSIALSLPVGVTVDGLGNIFITDTQTSQVVEVPASGTPSVLGTGSEVLTNPVGISFDSKTNAYIMDAGNDRVVTLVDSAVNFGTVAIGGSAVTIPLTFTIDPGTQVGGTSITTAGVASADFALSSTTCTYGTTASSCTINATFRPQTVGVRKAVLVIKNQSAGTLVSLPLIGTATGPILAFTPGVFSTVAGTYNTYGPPATGGFPLAISALLEEPRNIALDDAGNFFFLDYGNWVVREVTPAGCIYTVLGDGGSARWFDQPAEGDGGPALDASISALWGVGIDASDNIFIADYGMNQIREETGVATTLPQFCRPLPTPTPPNGYINTFAGIWDPYYGRTYYGGDGGPALNAELTTPWAVLPDNAGNVYVSDYGNHVVRKISSNGVITTVAGDYAAGAGYSGDGHPAILAQLYTPEGLALDGAGDLFIADGYNNVIRKVTPDGNISTVAGDYALGGGYSGDNGPATSAQLQSPVAVALDGGGNLYIADSGNNAIRMVTPGGTISTVAVIGPCNPPNSNLVCYTGTVPGTHDRVPPGPTGTLTFQPYSIAAAPNGNLYFSDEAGNVIDKIDVSDPPSLTFAPVALGFSDTQQDVTIQNLGTAPLNISQISISSNFTFGSDTTCSLSGTSVLAQEQSCVLGITFSPQQTGTFSGSVTITDNSQGSGTTQTIPLNGTATADSPTITSVSPIASAQVQTITISGSGFASQAAYTGNSNYIALTDFTGSWTAGKTGDGVTLAVSSWTDSQIVLTGLAGSYSTNGHCIRPGDQLSVSVWNAQTGNGPAVYPMVASGATDNCATVITSVSPIVSAQTQTITITGEGFGSQAAYTGDSNYIDLFDSTGTPWNAGKTGDGVTLAVTSWTDTQIVLSGLSGSYGSAHCIHPGDQFSISVWNASTGSGPAVYPKVAASGTDNCAPIISSVSAILPQQTQTITITGEGFGTQAAYTGDSPYIEVTDSTHSWNAGNTGDSVSLGISSWTDSQIVLTGFSGNYSSTSHCIATGDQLSVKVWNAQTGVGPATYSLVASNGTTTCP